MKILIVGGGIGGLALAGFLRETGIDYVIIDKKKDWNQEGFSLGMWSNGRRMLQKLGLSDNFDKVGRTMHEIEIKNGKGKLIKRYCLEKIYEEFGVLYTHIKRADLHSWLLGCVYPEKIKMGTTVASIEYLGDSVSVVFSDGLKATFDLVVGADGVHSSVRALCFKKNLEGYVNWRVWYIWIENSVTRPHTVTEYVEPGLLATIFHETERTLVCLVACTDHLIWDKEEGRIERLRLMFKSEIVAMPDFLKGVASKNILPTDFVQIRLKEWVKGRAVLIGDAAHGFEPHAGLGASMALEDAYILAGELIQFTTKPGADLQKYLRNFEIKRRHRVELARHLTAKMRFWGDIQSPFFRRLANTLLPFVPEKIFVKDYMKLFSEEI